MAVISGFDIQRPALLPGGSRFQADIKKATGPHSRSRGIENNLPPFLCLPFG
jgi:hypothetical protein